MNVIRTNSDNPDFVILVKELDAYLAEKDGSEHAFYDQFNKIDKLKHVVIIYENEVPVACGAMKAFGSDSIEIKRMYTLPSYRGKGLATQVLSALEKWATEIGYKKSILETGKRQPEAIELYKKHGYTVIPN